MRTITASLAIATIMLVGCSQEAQPPADVPMTPLIMDAAVSANGIAVGADLGRLYVNDGGAIREVSINGIVQVLEPADTGVWAGAEGEVVFVRQNGEARYQINGSPMGILPSGGETAYVVTMDSLLFIGDGDHRAARRRAWTRYSSDDVEEIFHDLEQEAGGDDIHRYDP